MRRLLGLLLLFLMLQAVAGVCEDVAFYGVVTKDMTIRETRSKSGTKLGSVKSGDTVGILELGTEWTRISQDTVEGYILTKNIQDLRAAGDVDDAAAASFSAVMLEKATLRQQKDKKSMKLGSLEEGDRVYLTELGKEWHAAVLNGIPGYILASTVSGIESLTGEAVPEEYATGPAFVGNYTAETDVNLAIRKKPDASSKQLGTIPEKVRVEVMETDGTWAYVRRNSMVGYVNADHLRYYRRQDPFGPLEPGVVVWPYVATVNAPTRVVDATTGEELRVLDAGVTITCSALQEDMSVLMPYHRVTGRIQDVSTLTLYPVSGWKQAGPGELIAAFTTYYNRTPDSIKEQGRLFNIQLAIKKLGMVTVESQGVFQFNDYCAPYTHGNGYELGPIVNYVSSKKTGYGGGVCQVSTTLYDALLQLPVEIVRQQVHSSYGIFYAPLDMDAAVGAGNLDLRFRNVLDYPVVLVFDTEFGVLTVRIFRGNG